MIGQVRSIYENEYAKKQVLFGSALRLYVFGIQQTFEDYLSQKSIQREGNPWTIADLKYDLNNDGKIEHLRFCETHDHGAVSAELRVSTESAVYVNSVSSEFVLVGPGEGDVCVKPFSRFNLGLIDFNGDGYPEIIIGMQSKGNEFDSSDEYSGGYYVYVYAFEKLNGSMALNKISLIMKSYSHIYPFQIIENRIVVPVTPIGFYDVYGWKNGQIEILNISQNELMARSFLQAE